MKEAVKGIQTTATVPYHYLGLSGLHAAPGEELTDGKVDGQCFGVGLMGVLTQSKAVRSRQVVECPKCHIQLPC